LINKKFNNWFNRQKKNNKIKVEIIDINKASNWKVNKDEIFHISKKFFKIIGIKVNTNFFEKNWDQPIIIQNELGILGIIKDPKKNKYLLQAKFEPGNKNKIQLSPTVQATKSNFSQIHGGKKVPYLSLFLKHRKKDIFNQSEQGFRYLYKFNSNILVNSKMNIKTLPSFFWFKLPELVKMIRKKNLLNMDTLSVISSHIKLNKLDKPINSTKFIEQWFKKKDKKFFIKSKIISLSKLKDWIFNYKKIVHKNNDHFSVIAINVETNKREVNSWCQPIIRGKNLALSGFIIKKFNNTDHYLCRYILKPGLKKSALTCTVNTGNIKNFNKDKNLPNIQKKLLRKFFLNKKYKKSKIFDNIMSDEGGRFFHSEIRYLGLSINDDIGINLPSNYIWVSQNQLIKMIKKKKFDIEGRLLFGCLNISNLT
jgi:dTDP-4-dehydro-6-deoxy-alpha-D-glucopyranose 2,3-dehydratase